MPQIATVNVMKSNRNHQSRIKAHCITFLSSLSFLFTTTEAIKVRVCGRIPTDISLKLLTYNTYKL